MGVGAGTVRAPYKDYHNWFDRQDTRQLQRKHSDAERSFRRTGITFNVYGESEAEERLIPFDLVPRIIGADEWRRLTRGIEQRVRALNAFMHDLYHRQEIVRSGRLSARMLHQNAAWLPNMVGFSPPGGVYTHIVGIDLVRTGPDQFYVLEDNARTPSGVSYMLENRETMMAMFPELFMHVGIESVSDYPRRLAKSLAACAPQQTRGRPVVAVLTPGIYNSAYFEHAFLADQMGAELVEGNDLRVVDGRVAMRTTRGYRPIDVLYRRVDDEFLDPLTFHPDSVLGVPGIIDVYRSGGITIANAPGTGVADDKAIYSMMPEIVEFYTGEKPLLPNVETWRCADPDDLAYTPRQSRPARGEGGARVGWIRNVDRAGLDQGGDRGIPQEDRGAAGQLYRAAYPFPLHMSDLHRERTCTAPCRFASVRPRIPGPDRYRSGWPDSCRAERGVARREFQSGRWDERYMGVEGLMRTPLFKDDAQC